MVHGGTNACGFQNTKAGWGEDPTPYNGNDNIHIEGGWIDLTEVDAKTGNIGIELLGCRDSSVDCKCTGGAYGVILGGAGTAGETPCQRIKVRGTFFPLNANSTGGVAVTNCEDYDVDVMVRCPDASGTTLCLDCEPNAPTDTLKGGRIKGNFYGGRVITQSAAATDPDRMAGIDLSGINLHDGATMTIATPGTVVNGYTVTASGSPAGGFPNVAISVERTAPSATMAADGTTISGGTIRDVPASNTFPGIKVQDASYCMIAGNAVVDDRPTSYTNYAVEEKVLLEHVVSGCAASAGAGMKVKVAAGEVESEAKAKQAVAGNEVTIEAADALKERVDLIVVKLSTGVASIVKGGYPVQPELPAPALLAAAPYTPAGYTPVARVVVKAAVTEIKAANILDNRLFATNNNVLGPTAARGTLSGTHKKVGANTEEVVATCCPLLHRITLPPSRSVRKAQPWSNRALKGICSRAPRTSASARSAFARTTLNSASRPCCSRRLRWTSPRCRPKSNAGPR